MAEFTLLLRDFSTTKSAHRELTSYFGIHHGIVSGHHEVLVIPRIISIKLNIRESAHELQDHYRHHVEVFDVSHHEEKRSDSSYRGKITAGPLDSKILFHRIPGEQVSIIAHLDNFQLMRDPCNLTWLAAFLSAGPICSA